MTNKLYPFSFIKHGHNIELAYNHQWLICREMEDGERPWEEAAFKHLEAIVDVLDRVGQCGVVWVTGKDWAFLNDLSVWAECYRSSRNGY